MYLEAFGVIATAILIISMMCNCKDRKTTITMRLLNAVAAIMFIIYSSILAAYSSILSNSIILLIDIFYLYKLIRKV